MVKLDEKDLCQILIAEFRYAVRRDNHLAPSSCTQHIKDYLPDMSKPWRAHIAKQLSEEIIDERLWNSDFIHDKEFKFEKDPSLSSDKKQLREDYTWEELLVFLSSYLEMLPANVDRYMTHIYNRMTYSNGIDYYSTELYNKLIENRERD